MNLGSSLAEKLPTTDIDPMSFMKTVKTDAMLLNPVTEEEIKKIMQNMKSSGAGWDEISPKIIKLTFTYFMKPLVHICNMLLEHGFFSK